MVFKMLHFTEYDLIQMGLIDKGEEHSGIRYIHHKAYKHTVPYMVLDQNFNETTKVTRAKLAIGEIYCLCAENDRQKFILVTPDGWTPVGKPINWDHLNFKITHFVPLIH